MPAVSDEIIADITDHIQKSGGDFSAWCVGIARDGHNPVFEAHQREDTDDALIYREAYTPASARFHESSRIAPNSYIMKGP